MFLNLLEQVLSTQFSANPPKQNKNLTFKVQKTPSPMLIIMDMMTDTRTGTTEVTKIVKEERMCGGKATRGG
jgi:hypothetical protein